MFLSFVSHRRRLNNEIKEFIHGEIFEPQTLNFDGRAIANVIRM